jgi:short-subunit dehydrogenase
MCFIERPVLAELGFDPRIKPMSVEQCVSEGLNGLRENRSRIIPGRLNRFMDAFVPAFVKRTFTAKMLGKALANKHIVAKEFGGSRCPTPS